MDVTLNYHNRARIMFSLLYDKFVIQFNNINEIYTLMRRVNYEIEEQ